MRCIIPIGCLKQSQAVPWKGSGVSRRMFHPLCIEWRSRCPGTRWGVVPMPRSRHHSPSLGTQRCGGRAGAARSWDRTCFPDLSCLPAVCAGGAFAASSLKCPQVCADPEQPHGTPLSSAPTAPTFGFPCPGSVCPARAWPPPSAPLSPLQVGFHFRAALCVSPARGDRQTGWVTGQSRAVQSNFQAGWTWGRLLMGSCKTGAFPAFPTQLRLLK